MGAVTVPMEETVAKILASGSKSFRGMKFNGHDFSNLNLQGADFRNASVPWCKFDHCNLKYANFEYANCFGSTFHEADLHRANFKNADTSACDMSSVKDLFGVTVTLECSSFKGLKLSPGWWYGWGFYMLLMEPPTKEAEDKLIQFMGVERYRTLREQYARRRL